MISEAISKFHMNSQPACRLLHLGVLTRANVRYEKSNDAQLLMVTEEIFINPVVGSVSNLIWSYGMSSKTVLHDIHCCTWPEMLDPDKPVDPVAGGQAGQGMIRS